MRYIEGAHRYPSLYACARGVLHSIATRVVIINNIVITQLLFRLIIKFSKMLQ
jgi:hypothetical protein